MMTTWLLTLLLVRQLAASRQEELDQCHRVPTINQLRGHYAGFASWYRPNVNRPLERSPVNFSL